MHGYSKKLTFGICSRRQLNSQSIRYLIDQIPGTFPWDPIISDAKKGHSYKLSHWQYSPGEASPGILTSISATAYEAVFHSKSKDQPVANKLLMLLKMSIKCEITHSRRFGGNLCSPVLMAKSWDDKWFKTERCVRCRIILVKRSNNRKAV